jgi:hypothetical protein
MNGILGKPIGQVGIVVYDLEASLNACSEIWQNGPWRCITHSPETLTTMTYRGEPGTFTFRIGINSQAPQIEYIQPLSGENVYSDWLSEHGEGVHHVAVHVPSLADAVADMAASGFDVTQSASGLGADGSGGFAYFNTVDRLGIVFEALELVTVGRTPELVIP